ncbi:WD domain-containing protein [Colletotrichum graminicola]|uniref:Elongator complex protein 2 n=1 Tax=Colletotrichum graminicola (strain M1.001 / M2 / FGSC 10212) TaxID=645133 RepID=E3QAM7_COLGM|nr:WD domain-containing protein [Colletotrichum graminicola M1.001]EFQ27915.1 WD domain-containing protein [Colletotrichum graminicola M1.001]WDK12166.1 WD domain-containing protein [Colletotrichum graminicola]
MTALQPSIEYLSTGANRQTDIADWSPCGLLAYGADSNIALWTPSSQNDEGIVSLLSGHKEVVKTVKFLLQVDGEDRKLLVSGSDDQTLKVWSLDPKTNQGECVQTVHEHSAPVNCIAILHSRNAPKQFLLASGAADATIKIWQLTAGRLQLRQTIKTSPKYFPLCLALTTLDEAEDVFVLAAAGTKTFVQIFVAAAAEETLDFKLQATLSGHEGWIRSLDFTWEKAGSNSDLLLASASQDKYVRLWRLHLGKELPSLAAEGSDPSSGAYLPGKSPSNKAHRLQSGGKDFSITFEALLLGHEDWIYSAKWFTRNSKLQLLSTSADNSLAMWEADSASGIWVSMVRLGEISREKGATTATGSIGGFWTGLWGPDGKSVVCLGRTGSWRRWVYNDERADWHPAIAVTGHTKTVTGIAWSRDGDYLMSTSSDQTTRLHARWKRGAARSWHEMSRPQIHGYDLNCIDTLGASQFVSGADEKLMRVFSEPRAVAQMLQTLGGIQTDAPAESMPDGANMPVLGLSNKAIDAVDDDQEVQADSQYDREAIDPATIVRKSMLDIDHPPFEESLSRHTLWPETEKLYGHGYEISCLAASHDGKLIASACKASSLNHAVIRIFETERWTEVRPPLMAHSLTATRLRFSPDDKLILSVGRDRQWAVFERDEKERSQYRLLQANPKGHTRMILDAAWAPSTSARVFATAGRDKNAKVWVGKAQEGGTMEFALASSLAFDGPVTAVDFLGRQGTAGELILAVGTESGKISLCTLAPETFQSVGTVQLVPHLCLPKPVAQLAWRPSNSDGDADELAIAGEDSSLRIYGFTGQGASTSTSK